MAVSIESHTSHIDVHSTPLYFIGLGLLEIRLLLGTNLIDDLLTIKITFEYLNFELFIMKTEKYKCH